MTESERLARKWVREYARLLPGSLDHNEAERCFLAGFEAFRQMAVEWAQTEVAVWKHIPLTPQDVASLAVAERMVRVLRALGTAPAQGEGKR